MSPRCVDLLFPLHHITFLPAQLPFWCLHISCMQNFLTTLCNCFNFSASTIDSLITHNSVSLYSQAADTTWINFAFRQTILCNASTDHCIGFPTINFQALAIKSLSFYALVPESLNWLTHQTKSSAHSDSFTTPFLTIHLQNRPQLHKNVTASLVHPYIELIIL